MPELSQAERKKREARTVTWIGRAIGVTGLGMTGVLSGVTAVQGSDSVLFQPAHTTRVANYETSAPTVTEVVIEVPVPSPLPPTHVPASASAGGYAGQPAAGAPPAAVVHAGVALPAAPLPAPVAVSTGSVVH